MKHKNKIIELNNRLNEVQLLRHNLASSHTSYPERTDNISEGSLQHRLREELRILYGIRTSLSEIPTDLTTSEPYITLIEYLSLDKTIPDNSILWIDLEAQILKSFPNFRTSLKALLGEEWNIQYYRLALLIKCRFKPVEISKIIRLAKSSVSSKRAVLCEKIMGCKFETKALDYLIDLL